MAGFNIVIRETRNSDFAWVENMLTIEPYDRIAPDSKSSDEVLGLLKQIYPAHKEKLGVVVLEFVKVGK